MKKNILADNLKKWSTLPAGKYRKKIAELNTLSDEELMKAYDSFIPVWDSERGWEHARYSAMFRGLKVLEVGSGLGYDALVLSKFAKTWTCADILQINIDLVSRLAKLKGADNLSTQFLQDVCNHNFEKRFNGFYAHGVLHHVPFAIAKEQVNNISKYLESGTKIALLMYPKERWEHAGKLEFENFGVLTDGEGTPWAEWYDDDKIKQLMGHDFELDNTIHWGWKDIEFVNFELTKR